MQIWITLAYVDGQEGVQQLNVHNTEQGADNFRMDDQGEGWEVFLGPVETYGPFEQITIGDNTFWTKTKERISNATL